VTRAEAIRRGEAKIKSGKRLKYGDTDVIAAIHERQRLADRLARQEACTVCKGKGVIVEKECCPTCDGDGEVDTDSPCECQDDPS